MKTITKESRVNTAELAPRAAPARYRAIQLSTQPAFPFDLNGRDQVAFTEIAGSGRRAKFYDGRTVLDLGTLGGPNAEAAALNDVPQVAGDANFDQSGLFHAYRWSRETGMVDLGMLPGTVDARASDINSKGEVVGIASFADPATPARAVLWRPGSAPLDLGLDRGVFPGMRINDSTQVAGLALDREGTQQAFSWTPTGGAVQLRGRGILSSDFRDLNSAGQITGIYEPSDGSGFTGYLWTPRRSFIGFTDPLRPVPFGMNDKGMVVGVLFLTQTAFVWTREEGAIEIGLPGEFSNAYEVNNFSQVVGQASGAEGDYAFIWTREDGLINLNTRLHNPSDGLRVTIARQINDRGTILASTNLSQPVLLVPFPG